MAGNPANCQLRWPPSSTLRWTRAHLQSPPPITICTPTEKTGTGCRPTLAVERQLRKLLPVPRFELSFGGPEPPSTGVAAGRIARVANLLTGPPPPQVTPTRGPCRRQLGVPLHMAPPSMHLQGRFVPQGVVGVLPKRLHQAASPTVEVDPRVQRVFPCSAHQTKVSLLRVVEITPHLRRRGPSARPMHVKKRRHRIQAPRA